MKALQQLFKAKEKHMATSSILGGSQVPEEVSGKDIHALGPSDNSDSGSDAVGAYGDDELASDSDAAGTGERASIDPGRDHTDADVMPDHIEQVASTAASPDLNRVASDDDADLSEVEDLSDDSENPDGPAGEQAKDSPRHG